MKEKKLSKIESRVNPGEHEGKPSSHQAEDELLLKLRTLERRKDALTSKDLEPSSETSDILQQAQKMLEGYLSESGGGRDADSFESEVRLEVSQLEKDIKETIDAIGGEEATEEAKQRGFVRMVRYGRKREEINDLIQKAEEQIGELRSSQKGRPDDPNVARDIFKLEETRRLLRDFLENKVARENPQAFITHWIMKLRGWRREYDETGIITTPNVERVYGAIRDRVQRALNDENKVGVFTLLGETGTGKTAAARRIASEFSGEHGYEFIQAHSRMVPEELITRFGLTVHEVDPAKAPEMIAAAQEQFVKEHPNIEEEEKNLAFQTIAEVVKKSISQKQFETETIMEPVARAAQEGKIVIIDEFNYLSPETLASLNAFLAAEPGKNGVFSIGGKKEQFLVQKGFGIIFTGNIGKNFIGRNQLGRAQINRILSDVYEYQYPAQEINKPFAEAVTDNTSSEQGYERDLFDSAVTLLADKKGNVSAPPDALETVWNTVRAFSIVQRLAGGEDFRSLGIDPEGRMEQMMSFRFESIALSFRQLNSVVEAWRSEGFSRPLDYYLYDMIIRPAFVIAPKEAAQIFYVFNKWGGLFNESVWDSIRVNYDDWSIEGLKMIDEKKLTHTPHIISHQLSDVARAISGQSIPAYQEFEQSEGVEQKTVNHRVERMAEDIEVYIENIRSQIGGLEATGGLMCRNSA